MTLTETTQTVTTITLPAPELGRMLANATLATASKKDCRPMLACVHLSYIDGTLTATATDSYWLLRETLPVEGDGLASVALLSAEDLAPVIKVAKARAAALIAATINFDGDRVTFKVDGCEVLITSYDGEFPNVNSVIGGHKQIDTGVVAFMSRLIEKAAKVVPSTSATAFGNPMRFTLNGDLKGVRIDWNSNREDAELFAILMPTRY